MNTTNSRPKLSVTSDGRGVVPLAGARLLADLAETTGLEGAFSEAAAVVPATSWRACPRPGRGRRRGETISDLAVLRDRAEPFQPAASRRPPGRDR